MTSETSDQTMFVSLKAPVEFFKRLDRWCLEVKERDGTVMAPSRPAAIRWIVHQFLLKEEAMASVRKQRQKLTKAATEGRSKPPRQRAPARHR